MVEATRALQQDRPGRHDEPQPSGGAAGDQVHARRRHRQGLHGARPLLQAASVDRQVSGRADGARREVQAQRRRHDLRADLRRAVPLEGGLRPVARAGAEAAVQPQPLPLQLALALGLRQRRHRQPGSAPVRHRAVGPAASRSTRSRSARWAATSATSPRRKRPTCRRRCSNTPTARSSSSRRAASITNDEGGQRIGNLFYGTKGWLWTEECGTIWQSYMGPLGAKNEKGPGSATPDRRSRRADDDRVPALPELRRRDSRQRSEAPRRATSSKATCRRRCRTWRTSRTASAAALHLRRQDRDVRERQGGRQAADARVPEGIRDPVALVARARTEHARPSGRAFAPLRRSFRASSPTSGRAIHPLLMPSAHTQLLEQRLRNQRLAGSGFGTPAAVVDWLGAVQAQDCPAARWAVGQRMTTPSDEAVQAALDRGEILRTHVLRPTWHFVTPADIRWMLAADRAAREAALRLPASAGGIDRADVRQKSDDNRACAGRGTAPHAEGSGRRARAGRHRGQRRGARARHAAGRARRRRLQRGPARRAIDIRVARRPGAARQTDRARRGAGDARRDGTSRVTARRWPAISRGGRG